MQAILSISDIGSASTIPSSVLLPTPINMLIHIMNRVHWVWRWNFTITQVWGNTNNLKKYILGHIVNFVAGNNIIVRVAAQVTMIATRIIDLGKQKVRTYYAFCDVYDAIFVSHPIRAKVRLPRGRPSFLQEFLGPDHYIWAMKKKEVLQVYSTRILKSVLELFKQMFYTSMCYMDVIEAFTINPETTNTAINHVFIHASTILDDMSQNKQHIHATLIRHKSLIEKILLGIGGPCKVETLISAVGTTLTTAELAQNTLGRAWEGTQDFFREMALGVTSAVGYQPGFLVNDPNPPRPEASYLGA
ncbi:MAG: hypothetical protein Q8K75_01120 [Chlamydiales bacterium]|nr:hypothetical protein [Chlamydiales bacterium]